MKIHSAKAQCTVDVNSLLEDAQRLMDRHHVRHIPVLYQDDVVGVISERDIARASRVRMVKKGLGVVKDDYVPCNYQVKDFMTCPITKIREDGAVKLAITQLLKEKVGALAVFNRKDELIGILTVDDLLAVLFNQHNIHEKYRWKSDADWYERIVGGPAGGMMKQVSDAFASLGLATRSSNKNLAI